MCGAYIGFKNKPVLIEVANAIDNFNKDRGVRFGTYYSNTNENDLSPLVPKYLSKSPTLVHQGHFLIRYDDSSYNTEACYTLPNLSLEGGDFYCYNLKNGHFFPLD